MGIKIIFVVVKVIRFGNGSIQGQRYFFVRRGIYIVRKKVLFKSIQMNLVVFLSQVEEWQFVFLVWRGFDLKLFSSCWGVFCFVFLFFNGGCNIKLRVGRRVEFYVYEDYFLVQYLMCFVRGLAFWEYSILNYNS